jgi:hypothetical protein
MFALVESGNITQMPKGNKGITLNGNQYPASIYTLWTEAERNAIGIYTVEIDNTNKKDEAWYINTNILMHLVVVKLQEHMAQLQLKR